MTHFDKLSTDELKLRQSQVKQHILKEAEAITEVVAKDIPRWLEREARKRWLEHAEFASRVDDEALARFKAELRRLGEEAVTQLRHDLADAELWMVKAEPRSRKTLEGHPGVWVKLQQVACKLAGLLGSFQFPPDLPEPPQADEEGSPKAPPSPEEAAQVPYRLVYRSPAYFVDGAYCPAFIETYWSRLEELNNLHQALDARHAVTSRQVLESRWEKA